MTLTKMEIGRLLQTDLYALEPDARDTLPITWFRTREGDYKVLSFYGDSSWIYPDSRFSAGTKPSGRKFDFDTVPPAFRASLKALVQRYDLSEKPAGRTLIHFCVHARAFLNYLAEMRVTRLSSVNPMHCANYVDHSRKLVARHGKPLNDSTLNHRFVAVEKLQRLAEGTEDAFAKPWPEASARYLAGIMGQWPWKAKTPIIPDPIWAELFQAANARLEKADGLFDARDKVNELRDQVRREGLSKGTFRIRAVRFIKERGYRHLRDFEIRYLELQSAAMVVVLSLSGIRVHELCYLKNNACYATEDDHERTYWMRSRSDKTGEGETEWMIPEMVTQALKVAERFAAPMQAELEANCEALLTADPHSPEAHSLLRDREKLFLGRAANQGNRIAGLSTQSVLDHLNRFAASVGMTWHFTPHQFRRSFARYVARSKFGDLRYLRKHFKHWSLDMTTLYAENERQDADLYDEIMASVRHEQVELITHWLDEDVLIAGGCAGSIRTFRTGNDRLRTYEDRRAMALRIADTVFIRATGAAWCTADDGGCGGHSAIEATRCGDCANSVIDERKLKRWVAIYEQQLELRDIQDLGAGAQARIERDIRRCEQVLSDLGVLDRVGRGLRSPERL